MVDHSKASRINMERIKQVYQQLTKYRGPGNYSINIFPSITTLCTNLLIGPENEKGNVQLASMLRTAKAQSMIQTSTPSPTTILTSVNSSGDYMCRTQLVPSSPNITYHRYKSPNQSRITEDNQQIQESKASKPDFAKQNNKTNKSSYHNIQTFSEQRLEKQQNLPYQKITPRKSNDQNINTEQIINEENQYAKPDQEMNFIIPNNFKRENTEFMGYENFVQQNNRVMQDQGIATIENAEHQTNPG